MATIKMAYPTTSKSISAGYPNYSSGSYHGGVDFPVASGTSVCAAADGIVTIVKNLNYSYGHYVVIYHSNGISTLYAHNTTILVNPGDKIIQGQIIAKSGSTGNSTGPHCHFEVRTNSSSTVYNLGNGNPSGNRVNPLDYLDKSISIGYSSEEINITIDYIEWTGYGTIKYNETNLLWYRNSNTTPTKLWGSTKEEGEFFANKGEKFNFLGKTNDGKYYYGWAVGLCNAKILCVIPCDKVNNINGKSTGKEKNFSIGVQYSNISGGSISGSIITIPSGLGTYATREFSTNYYKTVDLYYEVGRIQKAWINKGYPTVQGFAAINGKILIACTSTFGDVGDRVTWEFSNGDTLDTIIGDHKSQTYTSYDHNPANKWGHDDGKCILEFCGVPDSLSGTKGYNNPYYYFGWNGCTITRAANHGKYI
jgi:hypothetical protein